MTYLNDNPKIRILISGHTDDQGSEDYNLELSISRAKSVYSWLINNGIESDRLKFTGFGSILHFILTIFCAASFKFSEVVSIFPAG